MIAILLKSLALEDRLKAVEIVVENKAEARDFETDDDLPPDNEKAAPRKR